MSSRLFWFTSAHIVKTLRDAAESAFQAIRRQTEELVIKSPIAGVVDSRDLKPGDMVSARAPTMSVVDHRRLWVRTYVPQNRFTLKIGQRLRLTVDSLPGKDFAGHVRLGYDAFRDAEQVRTRVGYIDWSRLLVLGQPNGLKKLTNVTPPGTRRYEIRRISLPTEKLSLLRACDGVWDATLFGETIHALVDESVDPSHLSQPFGVVESDLEVRKIPPSLKDVFVTLTKEADSQPSKARSAARNG